MPLLLRGASSFAYKRNRDIWEIIQDSGCSTGCKLALDAGDATSFNGTGQTWTDLSGNGFNWYRGTTVGADGTDPTFNGASGGLSSNEYWSFDGGDSFSMAVAEPAWVDNLHKNNAKWSVFGAMYSPGSPAANRSIFGTGGISNALSIGWNLLSGTAGNFNITVRNASGSAAASIYGGGIEDGSWNVFAISYDEATGALNRVTNIDHDSATEPTYTSPSASPHTDSVSIGSSGDRSVATTFFESGRHLACFAMWEGTVLTLPQLGALAGRLRGRFGI